MKKFVEASIVSVILLAIVAIPSLWALWAPGGIPICTAPGGQLNVSAAGDGFGGAVVAWTDRRTTPTVEDKGQIYAQRISPNDLLYWDANGVLVCGLNSTHGGPAVTTDGVGGAIIAWHDVRANKPGIYTQRMGASGNALWTTNGVRAAQVWDTNTQFSMTTDRRSGAFLAWTEVDRIYFCWLDALGTNHGVGWFGNGADANPQIVADTAGAFIMWENLYLGIKRHFVDHIDADGSYYEGNSSLLCNILSDQPSARLCSDGAGAAIVVWEDRRNGNDVDIFAQRIDRFGNWRWPSSGVPVCTLTGDQALKGVITDGAGGVIVTFNNILLGSTYASGVRSGDPGGVLDFTNYDVLAQRLNGAGAALWGTNGVQLCGSAGNQIDPIIAPSADGGAFVLWDDDRSGSYFGVYGQRVDGTGMLQWGANGISVSMAPQTVLAPLNPVAVSNNAGGVSAFWTDYRNDVHPDIYAQGLDQWGGEPVVATLLQSFSASCSGAAVAVSWTLSEMDASAEFHVLRAEGSPGEFIEMPGATIAREGLSFVFDDNTVQPGSTYRYRVDVRDGSTRATLFETEPIVTPAAPLTLYQNQPNPFNPSTSIRFYLPERGHALVEVYGATGARIATLAEGVMEKGIHSVGWNGRDGSGRPVASGVYFCHLRSGKETVTKKMVLMR